MNDSTPQFDFSSALSTIKNGQLVARKCWGGGVFVSLAPSITMNPQSGDDATDSVMIDYTMHFILIQNRNAMPWLPNFIDLMASDWYVVTMGEGAQGNSFGDTSDVGTPAVGHVQ